MKLVMNKTYCGTAHGVGGGQDRKILSINYGLVHWIHNPAHPMDEMQISSYDDFKHWAETEVDEENV